jgi:hypothetical protein
MSKNWIIVIGICLYSVGANSQKAEKRIPLHLYLQENFDTTIIIHSYSAWDPGINYRIISVKNKKIHAFTYKDPLTGFLAWGYEGLPKDLGDKFLRRMAAFRMALPDTNTYFMPHRILSSKKAWLKQSLDSLDLWSIATVKDCLEGGADGPEHTIWLIVKNKIKELYFYDLEDMEKTCPGNNNRQKAIQLIKAFNAVFQ